MCQRHFFGLTPDTYSQVGGNLNLVAHVNFPEDDGIVQVESEREEEEEEEIAGKKKNRCPGEESCPGEERGRERQVAVRGSDRV